MTRKAKPKTKSKLTVQEFQTWLQGIMEFQSPDWSPNKEQWEAIYDKIMNLKAESTTVNLSASSVRDIVDAVSEEMPNFNNPPASNPYYNQPHGEPRILEEKPIEEFGAGGQAHNNAQPMEVIPAEELPNLSQEEIQRRIEEAKSGTAASSRTSTPIKTKSIDTSDGNYVSDFI